MNTLTHKEKKFADDILDGKKKRQAVKDNYDLGSKGGDIKNINQTADAMAYETSNKPNVMAYLEDNAFEASGRVVELSKTAKNEATKLNANKDILDRAGYKPAEKAININMNIKSIDPTDPKVLEALKTINTQRANEQ